LSPVRTLAAYLRSLRPRQWTKNGLVFAGVIFAHGLTEPALLLRAIEGFVAFSLLSGSVYLFNDLQDIESDRLHPRKRHRPVATGELPFGLAVAGLALAGGLAIALGVHLGTSFLITAVAYLLLNVAYSLGLKHVVLVDVMTIAVGFVLRAIAGVELLRPAVAGVELSPWLLVCTFFLALLLACGKRRQELVRVAESTHTGRRVLLQYNAPFLDTLVTMCAATTLVAYAIYTIWPETVEKFHTTGLLWTVPFVAYGVFRYLWLVRVGEEGEDPSGLFLADGPLLVNIGLWSLAVAAVLYWH